MCAALGANIWRRSGFAVTATTAINDRTKNVPETTFNIFTLPRKKLPFMAVQFSLKKIEGNINKIEELWTVPEYEIFISYLLACLVAQLKFRELQDARLNRRVDRTVIETVSYPCEGYVLPLY